MVQRLRPVAMAAGFWNRARAYAVTGLVLLAMACAAPGVSAGPLLASMEGGNASSFRSPLLRASPSGSAFSRPESAQPFRVTANRTADGALALEWAIRSDTYLYRNSITASVDGKALDLVLPPGAEKDDPNFGRVHVFRDAVSARSVAAQVPATGTLHVTWQGCSDQGICYPAESGTMDLAALQNRPQPLVASTLGLPDRLSAPSPSEPAKEVDAAVAFEPAVLDEQESSFWSPAAVLKGDMAWMLVAFLGFGLLLSLTPCIFPMIPILGGVLARSGHQSVGRGVALSSVYVLAMACAYGVLGLVAGWSGANLQAALQTPWALGGMAAVFVLLALSMFGLFDLQMPSALSSRLSGLMPGAAGGHSNGRSFGSAAVLGFGSALIVGPCVTPPLAAAMLAAAQSGDAGRGAAALFMLGLGMGLPLIAFGAFGARVLPRSGPWLVRVKVLFGLVFLAVALFLVTRLMDGPLALALWGVFALGVAVFIGGFDRLEGDAGWSRKLGKASGLALALYGALLITGFAGGASDPMRPLGFLSGGASSSVQVGVKPQVVTSMAGFEAALARARTEGRPALVSFTADWCTVCKSNEKVLGQPDVATALERTVFIAADVTDYGPDSRALMERFDIIGPPTMFMVDTSGREVPGSRSIGAIDAQDVSRKLEAVTRGG